MLFGELWLSDVLSWNESGLGGVCFKLPSARAIRTIPPQTGRQPESSITNTGVQQWLLQSHYRDEKNKQLPQLFFERKSDGVSLFSGGWTHEIFQLAKIMNVFSCCVCALAVMYGPFFKLNVTLTFPLFTYYFPIGLNVRMPHWTGYVYFPFYKTKGDLLANKDKLSAVLYF